MNKYIKGFSLVEIVVVVMIMTILTSLAIPSFMAAMEQSRVKKAESILMVLYNAQKNYFNKNNSYCVGGLCNNTANINANLGVNITDNDFTYACTAVAGFDCKATSVAQAGESVVIHNATIVLTGAAGTLNPACTNAAHPNYCPS